MSATYEPAADDGISTMRPNKSLAIFVTFIALGLRPYLVWHDTRRHSTRDNVIKIGRGAVGAASHGVSEGRVCALRDGSSGKGERGRLPDQADSPLQAEKRA